MSAPTIITMGCRLNAYESELMSGHAAAAGLDQAVIVNTCAVTAEAVRQAAQAIRKARRERPNARIIVTGCAAQIDPGRFAAMAEVDHVIGNGDKVSRAAFDSLAVGESERVRVGDIMAVREPAPYMLDGFDVRARTWVQIQNGCDHRCTFCVIPYGRGQSRSVPAGEVVAQIRRLVEAGMSEVVLTGVDITSYGGDLPGPITLGRLVRQILRHVPELQRLRLSSIDHVESDPSLLDAIAEESRLMPHLHLSLQAGDDLILKRMKRRHNRANSIAFCEQVRRLRPDMALGADLIAGFPTETEAHFANTLSLVDDCGLVMLHVFPYSARQGTPAALMPQVERRAVKERAGRLRQKGTAALRSWLELQIGAETDVFVECAGKSSPHVGRTPQFAEVMLAGAKGANAGDTVRAQMVAHNGRQLMAEAIA